MDKVVNQIFCTKNYDKFKFLKGNRVIKKSSVMKLRKSISNQQLNTPILVNAEFYIIDGQHRFIVLKELNLPIYYMIENNYGLSECQVLNSAGTNWCIKDFITGYSDLDYSHYVTFKNFIEMFPAIKSISTYKYVLQGNSHNENHGTEYNFHNGCFIVKDLNESINTAKKLLDFKHVKTFRQQNFIRAIVRLIRHKSYDHNRMFQKASYQLDKFVRCTTVNGYYDMLSGIYNYRVNAKDRIDFRYELSKK